jgi:hypothetical protein
MLSIKSKSNSRLRRRQRKLNKLRDGQKLSRNTRLKNNSRTSSFRSRRLMKFLARKKKLEFKLRRISKLSNKLSSQL